MSDAMAIVAHRRAFRAGARLLPLALVLLLTAVTASADICGYPQQGIVAISRKAHTVATFRVALAENRTQYRQGLMYCPALEPGSGLLFIYPEAARRTFWMKDTPLALAIIFADPEGRIKAIESGRPESPRRIHSPDGIQYVLEINYHESDPLRIDDHISLRLLPQ
jgi:uncharacterized membrane protein (UPF0127 family)